MKRKHLLLVTVTLLLTALSAIAQDGATKSYSTRDNIPFGNKLPPPDLMKDQGESLLSFNPSNINTILKPSIQQPNKELIRKNINKYRQQLSKNKNEQSRSELTVQGKGNAITAGSNQSNSCTTVSDFHLTRDINALAESNPRNFTDQHLQIPYNPQNDSASYAVLDSVIYFVADDGIHGNELWRSDGTAAGTYLVKDIEPGFTSSLLFNITAANGKIYFTAYSQAYGNGAWVSDGTESGTQLLVSVSEATQFIAMGKKVYFVADEGDTWNTIWETDGTANGTKPLVKLGSRGSGGTLITQATVAANLLFFTFLNYDTFSWELWRSDGTDSGTYHVGPAYPAVDATGQLTNFTPAQLTSYNNKLYFSSSDSTGRKLWVSDGTDAGTKPAPGNHDVLIDAEYFGTKFSILKDALYLSGEKSNGNGLYKYDASNTEGLIKIKDFSPVGDTEFIVPSQMQVVNNTLYFKVTNYIGGIHDELWSSKGTKASTKLVSRFRRGETINNLYNGSGILYFVKYDKNYGTELWRAVETRYSIIPLLVSDIFEGSTSSYPAYLTAFNGKLIFTAIDKLKGYELFMTGGNFSSTVLVKDINTVSTTSSSIFGFSRVIYPDYSGYSSMAALGKDVLFNAYERVNGFELYKSDGTAAGTELLNDVVPGEEGFNARIFLSKNNAVYFLAVGIINNISYTSNSKYSIYKTNGTKNSLSKITPDYSYIQGFNVADNGLVFYVVYNSKTSVYELWRSDSTPAGTFLLSSTLYNLNYLNVVGNIALFVAGDSVDGYELWKSDGSLAGTKPVKDINPGMSSSVPGGMFIYRNEAYFSAYDSTSSHPSFWKSNGTESGTIKLKDIDPWWGNNVASTARYFGVSNNILYFSAIDHSNKEGTVLWKTDGTPSGTKPVKDINPTNGDVIMGPYYLTDVNGTLFFTADDGVNGRELWKSDGTTEGTQLVKDITTGSNGSNISSLTSFAGELYFQNAENNRYYLWSSDGTSEGTKHVTDPGITDVGAASIFPTGDKLFISGYTAKYGTELYAGNAVANKAPAITLTIIDSQQRYTAPARIRLRATATDADGTITKVEFYKGKTLLQTETVVPYGFQWKDIPVGNYTLTAKAFDNCGNVKTSNRISISVVPNKPPVVSITTPKNNQVFATPGYIHITANAKDIDGRITRVEFYNGSTLLRTEYKAPYTYVWRNVPRGIYTITAVATDNWGAGTTSGPVTVKVVLPPSTIVSNKLITGEPTLHVKGPASLTLHPNPAHNTVTIVIAGLQPHKQAQLSLLSVPGIVFKTMPINTSLKTIQLDVSSLSKGVYLVKLQSGGAMLVKQFIKL